MDSTSNAYITWTIHLNTMDNFTAQIENVTFLNNSHVCTMDESALNYFLMIFYSFIFIIGLMGNGLALYVFLCIHSKRNSVQVYLLNAAIADLLLIVCLPFRIMYHISEEWKMGIVFCKVVGNLFYMNMYISIVLLGLISMDRYIKVKKSQRRHSVSKKKFSIQICCGLWAAAIFSGMLLIATQSIKEQSSPNLCFHYTDRKDKVWQAAFNYFVVLIFWIVFVLLLLSYAKIGKNLQRISRERAYIPNAGKYSRTAYKSFFVLFIFTVCFVPYHTFRIAYIATQLQTLSCYWVDIVHKTNEITLMFSAVNSCLDPIMYFLLSNTVRKTVFQLLWRTSRDSSRSESNTSDLHPGHTLPESINNAYSQTPTPINKRRLRMTAIENL
ncbi:probable G-protein coupled receptor 34 [Hyla sarda]|uniref:probable G-protein coupled receptor 34 n=1 Tax=Hyla sarda TaxID=327740 RepID=UPI0024C45EC4|nr:probable G-protein coupled receptor 34 [Hyla sarda]XP_056414136.1 probable G-protein coupled receptor 34 [Hyla sarda]XP_056414137.1 probable G-protein coupled receptor 34 [Hyla sarda]XP_056414138.1 probable G-protein coupled receptor 34 [Hyla sarda]